MVRAGTMALLLLGASLAGCLGDDEGAPLGSFSLVAAADATMEHGDHGHGAAAQVVELSHFNGSREVTFEYHEAPQGVLVAYQMAGGSATIRVLDGNFQQVANVTAQEVGEFRESIDGGHGVWTFNITGHDATGMLEVTVASPAGLGLSQGEPIVMQENLVLSTDSWDWSWDSSGHAHLVLGGGALIGSATVSVLDAAGEPVAEAVVEGPGQSDGDVIELDGAPGTWFVQLTTELYTGTVHFELSA